jgi:hypothetical protein
MAQPVSTRRLLCFFLWLSCFLVRHAKEVLQDLGVDYFVEFLIFRVLDLISNSEAFTVFRNFFTHWPAEPLFAD